MTLRVIAGFEQGGASGETDAHVRLVNAGATIQSAITYSGNYAARCNATGSNAAAIHVGRHYGGGSLQFGGTFRTYIATLPASGEEVLFYFGGEFSSELSWHVRVNPVGQFLLYQFNTHIATSSAGITTGGWKRITVKATLVSAVSVTYEIAVDDEVFLSGVSTNAASSAQFGTIFYLGKASNVSNQTVDYYFDDAVIGDDIDDVITDPRYGITGYMPSGIGSASSWTNGAGTAPTNVAERPADGDTGYIESSTHNHQSLFTIGGVGLPLHTILAVQVAVNRRETAGNASIFPLLRVDGATITSGGASGAGAVYSTNSTHLFLPGGAQTITPETMNDAEIGCHLIVSGSGTARVTQISCEILHTLSAPQGTKVMGMALPNLNDNGVAPWDMLTVFQTSGYTPNLSYWGSNDDLIAFRTGTNSSQGYRLKIPTLNPVADPDSINLQESWGGYTTAHYPVDGITRDVCFSTDFYWVDQGADGICCIMRLFVFDEAGGNERHVYLTLGSTGQITVWYWNGSSAVSLGASIATIPAGVGDGVDLRLRVSCGAGTSADSWALYINGVLDISGSTQIGIGGSRFDQLQIGGLYGAADTATSERELGFRNTALIRDGVPNPAGRIEILDRDVEGTYTQWTGTPDTYADGIWSSWMSETTDGERKSFYVNRSAIVSGDQVMALEFGGAVYAPSGAVTAVPLAVIDGNLYQPHPMSVAYSHTGMPKFLALLLLNNNPETDELFTDAELDDFEVGMQKVSGAEARCTMLFAAAWVEPAPQEIDLAPAEMSLAAPALGTMEGPILQPVVMHLSAPELTTNIRALSLLPVVMRFREPSQGVGLQRYVVPTARGRWWTVSTTQPIIAEEGYIWVDPTIPATPRIYQYVNGGWQDAVAGLEEAATRVSWDGGAASSSANLATIANLTGLDIPADEHLMIEATFANTGGVDVTALGVEINNITVMSGVAAPGTTTGEYGIWRIIIPRRDVAASLQGRSYILVPGQAQVVTTLASVPINTPITSIELLADPNSTVSFEIRNVVVNTLQT